MALAEPEHVTPAPADNETVPGLDERAVSRWRQLARAESPWLHEEVAARMVQRLQWFRQPPASGLHWAPLLGGQGVQSQLRAQWPQARWYRTPEHLQVPDGPPAGAPRRGWNPLQWLRSDATPVLPAGAQVGLLWANMWLHHEPQPQALLRRWLALLDTQGFLMFSCLGPDSLRELRAVYDREGWSPAGHAFTDMHDWGDMLVHAGFAEPVMDMERITLSFSSAQAVLQELRGLGRNGHLGRHPSCRGRGWRDRLLQALERGLPRDDQGRLLLTFEVIYGHATRPLPRPRLAAEQAVSVDDMRTMLRHGRR